MADPWTKVIQLQMATEEINLQFQTCPYSPLTNTVGGGQFYCSGLNGVGMSGKNAQIWMQPLANSGINNTVQIYRAVLSEDEVSQYFATTGVVVRPQGNSYPGFVVDEGYAAGSLLFKSGLGPGSVGYQTIELGAINFGQYNVGTLNAPVVEIGDVAYAIGENGSMGQPYNAFFNNQYGSFIFCDGFGSYPDDTAWGGVAVNPGTGIYYSSNNGFSSDGTDLNLDPPGSFTALPTPGRAGDQAFPKVSPITNTNIMPFDYTQYEQTGRFNCPYLNNRDVTGFLSISANLEMFIPDIDNPNSQENIIKLHLGESTLYLTPPLFSQYGCSADWCPTPNGGILYVNLADNGQPMSSWAEMNNYYPAYYVDFIYNLVYKINFSSYDPSDLEMFNVIQSAPNVQGSAFNSFAWGEDGLYFINYGGSAEGTNKQWNESDYQSYGTIVANVARSIFVPPIPPPVFKSPPLYSHSFNAMDIRQFVDLNKPNPGY